MAGRGRATEHTHGAEHAAGWGHAPAPWYDGQDGDAFFGNLFPSDEDETFSVEALLAGAPPLTCGPPGQAPASPLGLIFGERYWTPPPHAGAALPSMAPRTDEAAKQPRARRARAPRKTGAERKFKRRRTGQQDAVSSDYVATDALGRYGSSSCRMPCAPGVGPGLSLPTVFYKLRGGIYRCAHRPDKDRIVRFCRSCRGMELNWEQVQERAANVRAWYAKQGLEDEYRLYWGWCEDELDVNFVVPECASKGDEAAAGLPSATAVAGRGLEASERHAVSALAGLPLRQPATAASPLSPLRRFAPLLQAAQLPHAAPAAPQHVAAAATTPSGPAPGRVVEAEQLDAIDAKMETAQDANQQALALVEAVLAQQSPTWEEVSALVQRCSVWRKRAREAVVQLVAAELRLMDAMPAARVAALAAVRNAASPAVATAAAGGEPVATGAAVDTHALAALALSPDAAAASPGGGEQRVEDAAEEATPSPKRARTDST